MPASNSFFLGTKSNAVQVMRIMTTLVEVCGHCFGQTLPKVTWLSLSFVLKRLYFSDLQNVTTVLSSHLIET